MLPCICVPPSLFTASERYHIVRLTIWHDLFLKFWLVDTWFFAHWRHQRAATRLENVHQLNIRQGKKLVFQLSHRQPLIRSGMLLCRVPTRNIAPIPSSTVPGIRILLRLVQFEWNVFKIQSNMYMTITLGTTQKWSSWPGGRLIKHLYQTNANQIWSFLTGC